MALSDMHAEAMMQYGRALVVQTLAANAQNLDNEITRTGLTRKIKRIILHNRDNAVRQVYLYTGAAATPGNTARPKRYELTNFGQLILEPNRPGDVMFKFLSSATDNRLQAILDAAPVTGVEVNIDYFDDIEV